MWTVKEGRFGLVGPEYGTVVLELAYGQGAQIWLEKSTPIAPFAITVGLDKLLFHTLFCADQEEATPQIILLKAFTQQAIEAFEHDKAHELSSALDAIVHV